LEFFVAYIPQQQLSFLNKLS